MQLNSIQLMLRNWDDVDVSSSSLFLSLLPFFLLSCGFRLDLLGQLLLLGLLPQHVLEREEMVGSATKCNLMYEMGWDGME